ncbi:hypothetical protein VHEMI07183 [[Torrubiella] hemipterigena]|uniref:Uncharacterized protein n=1 Tax=[Torrubiella] hemipterigena TaxID=1531966 RepID=A0A0A1TL57_9HYPO|nr:hypothetical protein VHEMI07183 [[Torrubiella] hemipterigena]
MSAREPLPTRRPTRRNADPSTMIARAKANGYGQDDHAEADKETGVKKELTVEEYEHSVLTKGSELPELHQLKDFWQFFINQSNSQLDKEPTPVSLRTSAKRLKAGLKCFTGAEFSDDATAEINHVSRS